jgi:hypothetical protein
MTKSEQATHDLILAAQAVCQSVNGSDPEATRKQHAIDLENLAKAIGKCAKATRRKQ